VIPTILWRLAVFAAAVAAYLQRLAVPILPRVF